MQAQSEPISNGDRYALSLLEHDGLMTPLLLKEFGPLRAIQVSASQRGATFYRQSTLRTRFGDQTILNASLEISPSALPGGFLDLLSSVETPFGQLLKDHDIEVQIIDRIIYRQIGLEGSECRWGRRLTMLRADTFVHLCKVDELLVAGQELLSLRRDFS